MKGVSTVIGATALAALGATATFLWPVEAWTPPTHAETVGSSAALSRPAIAVVMSGRVHGSSGASATAGGTAAVGTGIPEATTLWFGGMDDGGLDEWWSPMIAADSSASGGGEFNSGTADSVASATVARSGTWSAKLTWTGPGESGTRLFRWRELGHTRELFAEAWYYVPETPSLTGDTARNRTMNLMQFKSIGGDGSRNEPFWYLVMKEKEGRLRPVVTWGAQSGLPGPTADDEVGFKDYFNPTLTMPVAKWFRIRAHIRQSNAFDGAVTFWLDNDVVAAAENVRTGFPDPGANAWGVTQHWSVNNYSDGLSPAPFSIYVDDARIYTWG